MLSFASTLVARAARLFQAAYEEPALWTISAQGRVVGTLMCEAGAWRLSWFDGAPPRLVNYAGRVDVDGDAEALAIVLSERLGAPVRLESLPV
ncbi:hypothetical protein [Reyranella sp.]|uniref:hypothetical protein n=1 Tax=Reyranella sp. TaxID=1929291 RepID=UPI003D1440F3